MDVFSIALLMKAQGAATVEAALAKVRASAKSAEKDLSGFDDALTNLGSEFKGLLGGLGVVAVLGKIVTETRDAEFQAAQLNSALKSTRGIAGLSAEALNEHAQALARISTFDDDAITGAQALLLTFTKIRGPIFQDATQAILNVAQAMGTDLRSATIQVGKALNDPVLGLTALSRAGIQFSEDQKTAITALVETNRVAEAQRVILAELETQFGGSAAAARDTFGGALQGLINDLGNLMTLSGGGATGAATVINNLAAAIRGLDSALRTTLGPLGNFLDRVNQLPAWFTSRMQLPGMPILSLLIAKGRKATSVAKDLAAVTQDTPGGGDRKNVLTEEQRDIAAGEANLARFIKLEKQRTDARDAIAKRNQAIVTRPGAAVIPEPITTVGKGAAEAMRASVRESVSVTGKIVNSELATQMQDVRDTFSRGFAEALGAGLANGFQVALSSKSISQGFKALTGTIFSSFGSLLVQFGTKALIANEAIQNMFKFLFTPGPKSAIAAAAIIAIGAGLQAAGQGILSSAAKGGGSSPIGSFVTGAPAPSGMMGPQMVFGGTMAGQSGSIAAATPVNVTIIGPNDPSAQRQMQELIEKANRRGNTRV